MIINDVTNYDVVNNGNLFKKHGSLFGGNSKRSFIVGPSDCGKTNKILALILHENGLRFQNIYVYSKSLYQWKYKYLRSVVEPLNEIEYNEFNDGEDIITIFDHVVSCSQDDIECYF